MRRREFMTLLGGAVWPLVAHAQQRSPRVARIGYLSAASRPDGNIDSFRVGMHGLGYVEGRDFAIHARYAERNFSRFPTLVEELLRANVELIVTAGPATQAAPLAGRSVPVVFGFSGDPVDAFWIAAERSEADAGCGRKLILPHWRHCRNDCCNGRSHCSSQAERWSIAPVRWSRRKASRRSHPCYQPNPAFAVPRSRSARSQASAKS